MTDDSYTVTAAELRQFIEQIEQLEQEVTALENQCSGEQELLTEALGAVDKEIKRIEGSKKSVFSKREKEASTLLAAHLKRYTMLLAKREGLAVVPVNDSVCQGCHMTLPPQQVNEVRRADKLNLCPTCQRILYIKEQEDESVGQ